MQNSPGPRGCLKKLLVPGLGNEQPKKSHQRRTGLRAAFRVSELGSWSRCKPRPPTCKWCQGDELELQRERGEGGPQARALWKHSRQSHLLGNKSNTPQRGTKPVMDRDLGGKEVKEFFPNTC